MGILLNARSYEAASPRLISLIEKLPTKLFR
jgi:hypothetical protein